MNKKADLSISIIIVAAISLLILVILSVLILRSGKNVVKGTGCEGASGTCVGTFESCPAGYITEPTKGCPSEDQPKCCIPLNTR